MAYEISFRKAEGCILRKSLVDPNRWEELALRIPVLEKILADRPNLHSGETETTQEIAERDTIYRGSVLENLNNDLPACCGIDPDVARFIYDSVSEESFTLETGSGLSTLVFALKGSRHTVVTPNEDEFTKIKEYARGNQISLDRVEFVAQASDQYLPQCTVNELDFVFIDGKHAFPWPMLDWFYTADKLKVGGICLLDDLELASVAILRDFLSEDPRWKSLRSFRRHTIAFRKVAGQVHGVAWHMQPYLTRRYARESRIITLAKRIAKKSGVPQALGIKRR